MTRPKNSNEQATQGEGSTIDVEEIKRLRIEPGEALLIRLPRDMSNQATKRMVLLMRDFLAKNQLYWPVLYSRDDIEFVAISHPELKLGTRPVGLLDGDEEL